MIEVENNGDIVLRGVVIANDLELAEIIKEFGNVCTQAQENIEQFIDLNTINN